MNPSVNPDAGQPKRGQAESASDLLQRPKAKDCRAGRLFPSQWENRRSCCRSCHGFRRARRRGGASRSARNWSSSSISFAMSKAGFNFSRFKPKPSTTRSIICTLVGSPRVERVERVMAMTAIVRATIRNRLYRRAMIDHAPHPLHPGRNRSGQFVVGHKKIGGRRPSGLPRRWTQIITRKLQKFANKRDRERHKRLALLQKLQINPEAYRKPIGPRRASSRQR